MAKKRTSKKWKGYALAGQTLTRKNKFCPKCGAGIFLAQHKERVTCGHCHYTEFNKK